MRARFTATATVLAAICLGAWQAGAAEPSRISLPAEGRTVQQALAYLEQQSGGMRICATQATQMTLTGTLEDVTIEEAVREVAKAAGASYIRAYLLERLGPGDTPYSAEQYITFLTYTHDQWWGKLDAAARAAFMERAVGQVQQPSDAPAQPQPPQAVPPPPPQRAMMQQAQSIWGAEDLIRPFVMMPKTEKLSLDCDNAPLPEVLNQFTAHSGYLILTETGIDGTVTLYEQDSDPAAILDKIAEATGSKWRTLYIVSRPVKLSDAQVQERAAAAVDRGWNDFWSRTPEERKQMNERACTGIDNLSPELRTRIASIPLAQRLFPRLIQLNTQLTPDQRQEFQPLMQRIVELLAEGG